MENSDKTEEVEIGRESSQPRPACESPLEKIEFSEDETPFFHTHYSGRTYVYPYKFPGEWDDSDEECTLGVLIVFYYVK